MEYSKRYAVSAEDREYYDAFWNSMKGRRSGVVYLEAGRGANGMYLLPESTLARYRDIKDSKDIFKDVMTRVRVIGDSRLFVRDTEHVAEWVPEMGTIHGFDGDGDLSKHPVERHKLAALVRLSNELVHSPSFSLEVSLLGAFADAMSRAEEMAFITGDGEDMPYGLLDEEHGAETGVTAEALTYDDVIALYFSVEARFRRNGKWLMNDETAYALRTMKDSAGNYLWNQTNDTILGKEVIISEYMPSEGAPILFGDLSYYLIIDRSDFCIRELAEMFAAEDCMGYLGSEFLDGRLTDTRAVKALRLTEAE